MDSRLLKLSLLIPLFIACQAGSEIIRPDTDGDGDEVFTCTLSSGNVVFAHAYDYEPFELKVEVGEEAAIVDLSGASWLEIEGNVSLLYPDSHQTLELVPKEPNYTSDARSGIVVLKGKYSGESIELPVSQAGSSQETADSKINTWSLTSDLVSSQAWLRNGILTANQDDMNGILSLECSVNSPVEILEDENCGTFRGMQVGDAILMRMPVKNVEPQTGVAARVNLSQKTSGVQTEWVAEYWEGGQWNEKETFTTSMAESDFTYTTCACEFTLTEPIVNDYIKVRFRKSAGEGMITNFIAAAPQWGAEMKLTIPKKPLVLTLDFTAAWPLSGTPPNTSAKSKTEDEYTLTHDEQTYKFIIYSPVDGYYYTGSVLRFQGEGGGYVKLPAIEGKKLSEMVVSITNSSSKKVMLSSDGSAKGDVVSETSISAGGSKTFLLTGTQENTSYYLYTKAKHTQIGKIILTYE